jgi:hypothetical protein
MRNFITLRRRRRTWRRSLDRRRDGPAFSPCLRALRLAHWYVHAALECTGNRIVAGYGATGSGTFRLNIQSGELGERGRKDSDQCLSR